MRLSDRLGPVAELKEHRPQRVDVLPPLTPMATASCFAKRGQQFLDKSRSILAAQTVRSRILIASRRCPNPDLQLLASDVSSCCLLRVSQVPLSVASVVGRGSGAEDDKVPDGWRDGALCTAVQIATKCTVANGVLDSDIVRRGGRAPSGGALTFAQSIQPRRWRHCVFPYPLPLSLGVTALAA